MRTRGGVFSLFIGLISYACVSLLGTQATCAAEIPESPAGRALSGWFEVLQSDDDQVARAHYESRFAESFRSQVPDEQYLGLMGQIRAAVREARIDRVVQESDLGLSAFVQTADGTWLEILVQVDPDPDHRITGLLIRPSGPAASTEKEYDASKGLAALLDEVREGSGFPAIAAAWIKEGKVAEAAVSGVRVAGTDDQALIDDRFHIGSVTKSMTATMIGRLVELEKLDWDLTLEQALPGFELHADYRSVTLEQLLDHRAGITPATGFDDESMERLVNLPGSETAQRKVYIKEVLTEAPDAAPGTETIYSNAGYSVAGYIAERIAGKSWSELVRETVFEPLGLKRAGFGWPASREHPDQPRGHTGSGEGAKALGLDDYPFGAFIDPAGDVHCSIGDLARYASFHLAALRGTDGILRASTVRRLHTPPEGAEYAGGWVVKTTDDGEPLHWHNGSAGTFYALVALYPESNEAVVVMVNTESGSESAAMKIVEALRR